MINQLVAMPPRVATSVPAARCSDAPGQRRRGMCYPVTMAMRETERSLRGYFLAAGVIAMLLGLRDIDAANKLPGGLPMSWKLAIWFPIVARLALATGFLAAGAKLKAALPTGATWIRQLLVGCVLVQVVDAALIGSVLGMEVGRAGLIGSLLGLAVTAYLYANVRRLAAEAMAKTVPAARVV
jgi:hypothetical protein